MRNQRLDMTKKLLEDYSSSTTSYVKENVNDFSSKTYTFGWESMDRTAYSIIRPFATNALEKPRVVG